MCTQSEYSVKAQLLIVRPGPQPLSRVTAFTLFKLAFSCVPVYIQGMGTMFRDGRILCVLQVTTEHVLLGTQSGKIWVFDTRCSELLHASRQLEDSVLCLHLISR